MPDIEIAEFQKNCQQVCRVRLTEYGRTPLVDIRAFYQNAAGEWKPGKGISLRRELIPALIEALQEAERVNGEQDGKTG